MPKHYIFEGKSAREMGEEKKREKAQWKKHKGKNRMYRYSDAEKAFAVMLHRKWRNISAVSVAMATSRGTVSSWLKNPPLTWEERAEIAERNYFEVLHKATSFDALSAMVNQIARK